MLDSLITATSYLLGDLFNLLYLFLGVVVGIVFGIIPGLGGAMAIALLLPLTFGMEAEQALILMGGVLGAVSAGGAVTSILLKTPGTMPIAAICFDGYPMAQQGKAGVAIGAAAAASAIGGIFGLLVLAMVLPIARTVVLWFGPSAIFMMAVLGLTCLTMAGSHILRGLTSVSIGLTLGLVGFDSIGGTERSTVGINYLWDGISLVPMLIGLFAITEMITLYVNGGTVANKEGDTRRLTGIWEGVRESFRHVGLILKSSAIGTLLGSVPGVGGTVGSFMAYSFAAQTSRDNSNFGMGDIRGVIAPEAAKNAKDGGSLIPTLAFGIPGGAEMALFLGVLILHGLNPGPMLLIEREYTIFTLILTILAAIIASNVIVLMMTRWIVKIAYVDAAVLVPLVIALSLVSAYAMRGSYGDVLIAALFGLAGYLMQLFGYPRMTLVLALVLAELMERNYIQSMLMFEGDWTGFMRDPATLVLLLLTLGVLSIPIISGLRRWVR